MTTTICGIEFDIILRDNVSRDDDNYGKTDPKQAKIYIDGSMPEQMRDATLVHEWIHAVHALNGISDSEAQVCVLATELYRQGFRVKVDE